MASAEGEQLGRYFSTAFSRIHDLSYAIEMGGGRHRLCHEPGVAQNNAEEIIEIVRHAASEAAKGFHLLCFVETPVGLVEVFETRHESLISLG
jgi:hypothetical protein